MAFTKRTIITWNSPEQRNDLTLEQSKITKLDEMVAEEKTDNLPIPIDTVTTLRLWRDQAAADEWVAFIIALGSTRGYTANVVIEDHHPFDATPLV